MPLKASSRATALTRSEFMTADEVTSTLNIGRRSLDRLVKAGSVPAPIRFTARTVRWPRAAIEALSRSRA